MMQSILEQVLDCLQSSSLFEDVKVLIQYPKSPKEIPLKRTNIAIGIKKVETDCAPFGFGSGCGQNKQHLHVQVSADIHTPLKYGGKYCCTVFDQLLKTLLFDCGIPFESIASDPIAYDRTTGAYVLKTTVGLSVTLTDDQAAARREIAVQMQAGESGGSADE